MGPAGPSQPLTVKRRFQIVSRRGPCSPPGRRCSIPRILGGGSIPVLTALLAMLLALPSLRSGFQIDDWWMRAALLKPPGLETAFVPDDNSLFRIADGDPARTRQLVDIGMLPWWCPDNFKLWFGRPASEWTHRLDYLLWPDDPALMHLQSLLWFGAWILCVSFWFRRLIPVPWVAGLAGVLFALDDSHSLPACWLATRNSALAALCGTGCLLLHDAWRRRGVPWAGGLAVLTLGLALLCKEAAIGIFAYLLAYAFFLDPGRLRSRLGSVFPYVLIMAGWYLAYRTAGCGVDGSAMYFDPADSPRAFFGAVIFRAPILLLSQWALPPAETVWILGPVGRQALWLVAVGLLAPLFCLLVPMLRADRAARFFFAGMLLAVVPACLGMMSSRQLEYVGLGATALLALLLRALWRKSRAAQSSAKRHLFRVLLVGLGAIHLVIAPVAFVMTHRYFTHAAVAQEAALTYDAMTGPELAGKTVILLNPTHASHSTYLLIRRALAGQALPARVWSLAPGRGLKLGVRVRRLDARALEVQVASGIPVDLERGPGNPVRPGERIVLAGLTVNVAATGEANAPTTMVFEFAEPLESSAFVWLRMQDAHYVPWIPPVVGDPPEVVQ